MQGTGATWQEIADASKVHAHAGPTRVRVHSTDRRLTCPLHGSQFNVRTGAVLRGPAKDPLKTYRVMVDSEVGRVDVPLALAVQSE